MPRQYVACKFRDSDTRTFTYHNDGDPVAAGDMVKVPDRSGDGWKRVRVVEISAIEPPFPTKGILGKIEDEVAGEDRNAPKPTLETPANASPVLPFDPSGDTQ